MSNFKRKDIRILIVDDSIINQEIACDFIEESGFSLDTVDNGLQALEAVKQNPYSLVCMDIHMPVMDGIAATKAIREYEISQGLKPVPIIAFTSDTSGGIKKRCLEAGMNDHLIKPFTQQEIIQKITGNINDELSGNKPPGSNALSENADDNGNILLDAVEDIVQVSHWFWHISEKRIQFSTYLQHHFDFPLDKIKTLDDYIAKIGSNNMGAIVSECLASKQETRWEQKITEPGVEQPKYLLHRFRYVICEDGNPVLIGTIQDITSIRRAEQHILELASNDAITGLSSRFKFNHQIEDLIKYTDRHSEKFALLYLNIDVLNDNDGDETGDKLLIEFTRRLHTILRKSDFACRLVDNEFCLAIKDITDDYIVMKIAERYLELFNNPVSLTDKTITLNATIGMALYPQDAAKATDLIKAANIAMNKAKLTGDDPLAFFENALTSAAQHRLFKEKEIRAALCEGQFELYYQPKISLRSGEVDSVEAMIRWNHNDKNIRLPDSFLPDAERMNLMKDIGHWVIQEACDQIKAWREQGLEDIPVALNISQDHFEHPDFVDSTLKIVNDAGIQPSLIEIEITESISRDQKVFNDTCEQLRTAGFKTAIDDFGTGYTSLSELKDIPIDVLKIDVEFIRNLPNDMQSSIIIGTILGISNALGMQVVAEGVENNEQLMSLVAMGCHLAQGFYFSHPVPAAKIPALRKQNFRNTNIYRVA